MTTYLDLPASLRDELWCHLLQNQFEQVAFVFATAEVGDDTTIFTAKEHYLASPADFAIQSEWHVELTDDARARFIKRAWDTHTMPVEFHSHPGDYWGAMFSPSDMYGFADFVPHCRWRLRGRPYVAVVVTPRATDALVWAGASSTPIALSAIRMVGRAAIVPTHGTIQNVGTEEREHGP